MDSHQAPKATLITALILEGWIFEKGVSEGLAARDGRTSVRHVQGIIARVASLSPCLNYCVSLRVHSLCFHEHCVIACHEHFMSSSAFASS